MITLLATSLLSVGQPVTLGLAKPMSFSVTAKFDLVFTSTAKRKLIILNDGCSWGWDSTSFELKNPAGKAFTITRIPRPWTKNFPMGDFLKPLGKLTRTINLADGAWKVPAQTKGSLKGWQVRVVYAPETIPTRGQELFWTSKTFSAWTPAS